MTLVFKYFLGILVESYMIFINLYFICEDDLFQEFCCFWSNIDYFNFICDLCLQRFRWLVCLNCDVCSDGVYYGKNEKDILVGRQGVVEEILWCVMYVILEGYQSIGQVEQYFSFLKCYQGLGVQFFFGFRLGFQYFRDEIVS